MASESIVQLFGAKLTGEKRGRIGTATSGKHGKTRGSAFQMRLESRNSENKSMKELKSKRFQTV